MKIKLLLLLSVISAFTAGYLLKSYGSRINAKPAESSENTIVEKVRDIARPLDKYAIEKLSEAKVSSGTISQQSELTDEEKFTSYLFRHSFDPTLTGSELKTVEGQLNIPKSETNEKFPLVLLLRGFVSQEIYTTGMGSKNAAAFFAGNGFMTLAPDYLGYGGSDKEADNIFESRFQTYTTVLSLLKSLSSLPNWDGKNIFIWAHSNGGQVALTTLTVTGADYPTVLWAPVTKPFPYSVLYYTIEAEDRGKYLRHELSKFEELYDVELYSFDNYLDKINAPIELHQGTADEAVPVSWSNEIVTRLRTKEKDITYHTYPGADHNLRPSWDLVIARSLMFFKTHLK